MDRAIWLRWLRSFSTMTTSTICLMNRGTARLVPEAMTRNRLPIRSVVLCGSSKAKNRLYRIMFENVG